MTLNKKVSTIFYFENSINRALIVLILILCCNYLLTSFYCDFATNGLSDWLGLAFDLFLLILSCFLLIRKNIFGHLLALYFAYSSLSLNYEINHYLFNINFFVNSPQSFLTNLMNLSIVTLVVVDVCLILLKYFKPKLFQHVFDVVPSKFLKRNQLNIILTVIILTLLTAYWLVWVIVHKG